MSTDEDLYGSLQHTLTTVVRRVTVPRSHWRVTTRAGVQIDRVEAIALGRIADSESMRVTELADQLGVACSTAGRHAGNLERRGLVVRAPDEADGRVTVVTATANGQRMVECLRAAHRELLAEVLVDWNDEEVSLLSGLLMRLGQDLQALSETTEMAR